MKAVQKWIATFDELHKLIDIILEQSIEAVENASDKSQKVAERVSDNLLAFLIDAYSLGYMSTFESLGYSAKDPDVNKMREAIFKRIDGKTFEDRVRNHVAQNDSNGLYRLADSEYHRVFTTAQQAAAEDISVLNIDKIFCKEWQTMQDERVRDTHSYLQSVRVPIEEKFYTYDGDSAYVPGDFEKPENNVNCRCWLEFTEV